MACSTSRCLFGLVVVLLLGTTALAIEVSFDISSIDGYSTGQQIVGTGSGGLAGYRIDTVGDVNDDGHDDFAVTAPKNDPNGVSDPGTVWVVFGGRALPPTLQPDTLDGTNGFVITAEESSRLGVSISRAGDFNGDDIDDFIVGGHRYLDPSLGPSHYNENARGAAYLVWGSSDGFSHWEDRAFLNLSMSTDVAVAVRVVGATARDNLGFSVSGGKDINDDGYDDVVIGAQQAGVAGTSSEDAGASYIFYGRAMSDLNAHYDMSVPADLASVGTRFDGEFNWDYVGTNVLMVDDLSGDQLPDVVLSTWRGRVYVIFGMTGLYETEVALGSVANGTNGLRLDGTAAGQNGMQIASGDVNGDKFADLLMHDSMGANNGDFSGTTYCLFGAEGGLPSGAPLNVEAYLSGNDPTLGFSLYGNENDYNEATHILRDSQYLACFDVDGDCYDDVLVGSAWANANTGYVHLVYGKKTFEASSWRLDMMSATQGMRIDGAAEGSRFGFSVGAVGGGVIGIGAITELGTGAAYTASIPDILRTMEAERSQITYELAEVTNDGFGSLFNASILGSQTGHRVADAGDVNGDGYPDFLISGYRANGNDGIVYCVYGSRSGAFPETVQLKELDGDNGFIVMRATAAERIGFGLAGVGDFNNDGVDDFVIGAPRWSKESYGPNNYLENGFGAAYVIFGSSDGFPSWPSKALFDMSTDLDGTNGITIHGGFKSDNFGWSVSGGNDFNGDGLGDIAIGAQQWGNWTADAALHSSGAVYIFFGRSSGFKDTYDLGSDADVMELGIRVNGGWNYMYLGGSVDLAEDVTGDGLADLVVGSYRGNTWLIYGTTTPFTTVDANVLSYSNGTDGVQFSSGGDDVIGAGMQVGSCDFNGDNTPDILIHGPSASYNGANSGSLFVVLGTNAKWTVPQEDITDGVYIQVDDYVNSNDGLNGVRFDGNEGDYTDAHVNQRDSTYLTCGDVNDDSIPDAIVGTPWSSGSTGGANIIFGQRSPYTSAQRMAQLGYYSGLRINGAGEGDQAGYAVAVVGTLSDLLMGANALLGKGGAYLIDVTDIQSETGFVDVATLSLEDLSGSNGNFFDVETDGVKAGYAVQGVGDFNHDGIDDIGITAPYENSKEGAVYIVFGVKEGKKFNIHQSLGNLMDGTRGVKIIGPALDSRLAYSLDYAGDFNGDGVDDIVLGAHRLLYTPEAVSDYLTNARGAAYIVFGSDDGFSSWTDSSSFHLSDLSTATGVAFYGSGPPDNLGWAVSGRGRDVNGDGISDVVVGAQQRGDNSQGAAYIFFGRVSPLLSYNMAVESEVLDAGVMIAGTFEWEYLGTDVRMVGDMTGDGIDDIVISSFKDEAYLIYGTTVPYTSASHDSTDFRDGTLGVLFQTGDITTMFGTHVTSGDINGDSISDVAVHAPWAANNGPNSGSTYVIYGQTSPFVNGPLNVDGGAAAWRIDGLEGDYTGAENYMRESKYLGCGDVNQDGHADLVIGAWNANGDLGGAHVVYGRPYANLNPLNLIRLPPNSGFRIVPTETSGYLGWSVSAGFDLNSNGYGDIVLGARTTAPGGGAYYIDVANSILDVPGVDVFSPVSEYWYEMDQEACFGRECGVWSAGYPAYSLQNLDGPNTGSTFRGDSHGVRAGGRAIGIGDVNGDGLADFAVASDSESPNGRIAAGVVYVVFGSEDRFPASVDLNDIGDTMGLQLYGPQKGTHLGSSIVGVGDVSGDGIDDFVVGASDAYYAEAGWGTEGGDSNPGQVWLVFGSSALPSLIDLKSGLADGQGVTFAAEGESDQLGFSVAGQGYDWTGDGVPDIAISANNAADGAGRVYIVSGQTNTSLWTQQMSLSDLTNSSLGYVITGSDGAGFGHAVRFGAAMDGGAYADLFVSAPTLDDGVVWAFAGGRPMLDRVLATDTFANATKYTGANGEMAGAAIAGGDWNGDGLGDLAVFSPYAAYNGQGAGAVVVVFGSESAGQRSRSVALGSLGIETGARFDGPKGSYPADDIENVLAMANLAFSDFNGDDLSDLVIGSPFYDYRRGHIHVAYGTPLTTNFAVDLEAMETGEGVRLDGFMMDGYTGYAVSACGDLDGDGKVELLISGPNIDQTGALYVLYGKALAVEIVGSDAWVDSAEYSIGNLPQDVGATFDGSVFDGDVYDNDDTHFGYYWSGPHVGAYGVGRRVKSAGDINNDGFKDFMLAGPHSSNGGYEDGGVVYVVFGREDPYPSNFKLEDLDGVNGFKINSVQNFASLGSSISTAGDVNNDGVDDFLVGAFSTWDPSISGPVWNLNTWGEVWILFGSEGDDAFSAWGNSGVWDLSDMPSGAGVHLKASTAQSWLGHSLSGGKDVNGDRIDDIVIGAPDRIVGAFTEPSGSAYVVYGRENWDDEYQMDEDLDELGVRFDAASAWDYFGHAVELADDMNGDGFADIIVSAWQYDRSTPAPSLVDSGAIYVIYGRRDFASEYSVVDYVDGVRAVTFTGESFSVAGMDVSAIDFNGDGLSDLVTHSPGDDYGGSGSGSLYVAFGRLDGFLANSFGFISLSALDGTDGLRFDGVEGSYPTAPQARLLQYLDTGDFNGDGFGDILLGQSAYEPDLNPPGGAYVIWGQDTSPARRVARSFDFPTRLENLDATNGVHLTGSTIGSQTGYAVASAGDVNGDKTADVLVGAPGAGKVIMLYGIGEGYSISNSLPDLVDGDFDDLPDNGDKWKDPCKSRKTIKVYTTDLSDNSYWQARPATRRFLQEEAAEIFKRNITTLCAEVKLIPMSYEQLADEIGPRWEAGALADVMQVRPDTIAYFADNGWVDSLQPYFNRWSLETRIDHTANFAARVFYDYQYLGEWFASPLSITTRFLIYRADVFREVLGHDDPPATYEEMFKFAKKINETKQMWGLPLPTHGKYTSQVLTPIVLAHGGRFYNDNERCTLTKGSGWNDALDWYTSFYKNNLSPLDDLSFEEAKELFLTGQSGGSFSDKHRATGYSAMQIGYWSAIWGPRAQFSVRGDEVKVAPLPWGPAGRFSYLGGEGYALNSRSNLKEEAWEWIRFMSDPFPETGFMRTYATRNFRLPSRIEAMGPATTVIDPQGVLEPITVVPMAARYLESPFDESPLRPAIEAANWGVPMTFPSQVTPVRVFMDDEDNLNKFLTKISTGKMSAKEAAREICAEFDANVDEYRAPTPYGTDTTLGDDWMIPLLVVNSVLVTLCVVGALFCFIARSYAHIHYATWRFCVLMWLGCMIGLVGLYWWIIRPPRDWMCYLRIWFPPVAFVLVFGALSAKTIRVNLLFHNKKMKLTVITNGELLRVVAGMMAFPIIWAAVWSGVGNPEVDFVDVANEDQSHFKQCSYDHYWIFMSLIYAYLGIILLVNCYLAFRTRNVAHHFNESKEMISAVYSVTILCAVCLPLVHVFHDLPEAAHAITICGAWAAIILCLSSLFAFKFYMILSGQSGHYKDANNITSFGTGSKSRPTATASFTKNATWSVDSSTETPPSGGSADPGETREFDSIDNDALEFTQES